MIDRSEASKNGGPEGGGAPAGGPPQTVPPQVRPQAIVASIVLVAGIAEMAYMLLNFSAMPVYLTRSMNYGAGAMALIGSAFLFCEGVMKGPFGILGDRIGRKALIVTGPAVSACTSLATLMVQPHQWYAFALLRVLDGLGAAALWPSALAMIADIVPEERRSQAMSMFNVTYLIGVALGPMIGGVANDVTHSVLPRVDHRQASFIVVSVLFALGAVVALWRIPNVRPHHEHSPSGVEGGFSLRDLTDSLRRTPQLLVMAFLTFAGIGLIMLVIKLFAMAEFGVSEREFGALLLVPALVIAAASVPLGTIGDRIGKARAVRLGIGVCAFSMWSLILMRSEIALIIGGSLIGIGFVISFPSWMAYVSASCDPRQRGAVMGAVGTAQGLGAMLGVPIGGYLYEHAHLHVSWAPWINAHYVPFIGCAGLLLCAWFLALATIHEVSAQ